LKARRRFWSDEDLTLLAALYPSLPTQAVAQRLQRTLFSVYGTAQKRGLKKSPEFLDSEESGRLRKGEFRPGTEHTRFKKGQVPANKGLRRPGWAPGRMRETQFRKGDRTGVAARNWRPIGTILPDPEGYLRIKVREAVHGAEATGFGNVRVWPLLARHVWEQGHGPIPPGHVVAFKDRDRGNCAMDNLELISRAELAHRNRMWGRLPRELAEAIQLNGALKRTIRSRNGKEQNR
jgi:hypothetical protein